MLGVFSVSTSEKAFQLKNYSKLIRLLRLTFYFSEQPTYVHYSLHQSGFLSQKSMSVIKEVSVKKVKRCNFRVIINIWNKSLAHVECPL